MVLIGVRTGVVSGQLCQFSIAKMPGAAIPDMKDMAAPPFQNKGGEGGCCMFHIGRFAHAVKPAIIGGQHPLGSSGWADRIGLIVQPINQRSNSKFSRHPASFCATHSVGQSSDHAVRRTLSFGRRIDTRKILIVRAFARLRGNATCDQQSTFRFQNQNSLTCVHAKGAAWKCSRQVKNGAYAA
jgi:hypothetical protein